MRRESEHMGERPIRLVEFTRAFYLGGTEVQVVELLRGLPQRYQVKVACLDETGPLLESVWKLGYFPASFPLKGSVARPNTAVQVARLAHWLAVQRIDLVHVHDFYATLLAVPAAKLAGVKVIVGRLDLAHWHGEARRAVLAQLTRMADHVIANADAVRRMLVKEEMLPPEKISVIHNGLDLPRFDERRREELEAPLPDTGGAPVVVHVANMNHPVKRQEDLLQALAQLKGGGTALHAYFVGNGPRRVELEALAKRLGVEAQAHFLGHRTDVPAIYGRANLGVLCSSAEGLSNAVMEGMAAGLPMVVTDVGGNPELIAHGERGLVVPACQPERLASALHQVLSSGERAQAWGRAARAFVEQHLTLAQLVNRHDAVYRRVARLEPAVAWTPQPA
jgi:glycosyltransferase involved in cell wall biosynthesis